MGPIKSLGKIFQQFKVEDLLEKGLTWKGGCSSGSNHLDDEGSSDDNTTEFGSEIDEEDVQFSLIMQENDTSSKDDLKDHGLNHLLQQESTNQIMNLILQDWHYKLLDEYIIEGDVYADWFQWTTVEESKKIKGVFVIVPMLNLVHYGSSKYATCCFVWG